MAITQLQVENLSRSFPKKGFLFQGINLEIQTGQSLALVGPNGAGKTTLLKILATLLKPSSGEIRVNGHSAIRDPRSALKFIGWAPAGEGGFFPQLSGAENLSLFSSLRKVEESDFQNTLRSWSTLPVFREAIKTPYYLCSSGMKQSLNLCRLFLSQPKILLLDEPTRNFDPKTASAFREILSQQSRDKILIFSTHTQKDADALAQRVFRLSGGKLEEHSKAFDPA